MKRKQAVMDFLDLLGVFAALALLTLLAFYGLAQCILLEERRHVDELNYSRIAGDMRVEARYRAGVWLRGGRDNER